MRATLALLLLGLLPQTGAARQSDRVELLVLTDFSDLGALATGPRHVWAASANGIIVYNVERGGWDAPIPPPPLSGEERPTALARDELSDVLWLGTDRGRLFTRRSGASVWEPEGRALEGEVYRILAAPNGDGVVVLTVTGWHRWRRGARRPAPVSDAELPPRALAPDPPELEAARATLERDARLQRFELSDAAPGASPNEWWIATRGGGLLRFSTATLASQRFRFGTQSEGIGAVASDGERLWFGGDGLGARNGITTTTRALDAFRSWDASFEGGPAGFVARIVPTDSAIWFAASDGVYRLSRSALERDVPVRADWRVFTTAQGLPTNEATSIAAFESGVWVGTLRGLVRIEEDEVSGTLLAARRVMDVALSQGTLWIATDEGLVQLPDATGPVTAAIPVPVQHEDLMGVVTGVLPWGNGVIAMTPDALYVLNDEGWTGPVRAPALSIIGDLYRMATGPAGLLWIAGERGVAVHGPVEPEWVALRVPEAIPAGPVRGIAFEPQYVWLATPAGAVRLLVTR